MKKRMNKKSKGYPKRDERRDGRRDDRDSRSPETYGEGRNDVTWYTKYPNLAVAAGSFPYPYRPGMNVKMGDFSGVYGEYSGNGAGEYEIPGVLVLDWVPSLGRSNSATDPASIMAKEFYAKVRKAYSGDLSADAPDFVIYLGALDSIFTYLAWLKRLYRVMNAWTPENYVLPDVLLSAMGLSAKDILQLRQNRMQLWQVINELILQSRKFTCPAVMDLMNRHYWMSDNVYADAAEINSQFYMFNPKALYKFAMLDMADGNPGPGLQMIGMPNLAPWNSIPEEDKHPMTPTALYEFGRSLIDALVAWDGAYVINGYLMRAFEGVSNFIVDELPADQPFNPMYEPEVLAQIENSRGLPYTWKLFNFEGFNVTQDVLSNAIISNPSYSVTVEVDPVGALTLGGSDLLPTLSIRSQSPTVADNIIASRLQAAYTQTVKDNVYTMQVDCGTEVPLGWYYVSKVRPRTFIRDYPVEPYVAWVREVGNTEPIATLKSVIEFLYSKFTLEAFDWHPITFLNRWGTLDEAGKKGLLNYGFMVTGDVHNLTVVSKADLENLHKICIYSELNAFSI